MNRRAVLVLVVVAASAALLLFLGPLQPDRPDEAAGSVVAGETDAAAEGSLPVTTLPPTTSAPPSTAAAPSDAEPREVAALAEQLIASPNVAMLRSASNAMGASGDVGWVPYLVDMVRLFGTPDTLGILADDLSGLTGEPAPEEAVEVYRQFGSWVYDEEPVPVAGYIDWKARLYGLVDPAFTPLLSQVDDPVLASQIQWGGVRRGGIPELNEPEVVAASDAIWMTDEELTFGVVVEGETRAFPHRILDHHELANDVVGGEPVALANCTLCRTGVLFSRRVGDEVLSFQTSGLLRNSNKVMVDRETGSLWNQLTGEAIAGPLTGTVLDRFPITVTTYGDWLSERPDTEVLALPVDGPYSYEPGEAYEAYYASEDLWFPAAEVPGVFSEKTVVATLDLDGERIAIGVEELAAAGAQSLVVGERVVIAVPTEGGARFYAAAGGETLDDSVATEDGLTLADGSVLLRIESGQSFWFAWYANFPDTRWWPADV